MTVASERPTYLKPGTRVGPYDVEEQLGVGGFGVVYRVRRDGKAYALKIAHQKLSSLPAEERVSAVERLDREIAALKSLRHPNIVRVHTFERWPDLEGGFPYIVMDLVDGQHLDEWREAERPSLPRVLEVLRKLAEALAHMHELEIIHRDLKAQNILVRDDGEPIIVDFGIARPRLALDVTRTAAVGTIRTLTPEYAAFLDSEKAREGGVFEWRPAADLYGLGFVAYQLLTGEPPVPRPKGETGRDEQALMFAIKHVAPKAPRALAPELPEPLDALVLQLLEKEPERRPQSAAEVVRRLSAIAAGVHEEEPLLSTEGAPSQDIAPELGRASPVAEASAVAAGARAAQVDLPEVGGENGYRDEESAKESEPAAEAERWATESELLRRAAAEFGAVAPKPKKLTPSVVVASATVLVGLLAAVMLVGGRPPASQGDERVLIGPSPASEERRTAGQPPGLEPNGMAPLASAVPPAKSVAEGLPGVPVGRPVAPRPGPPSAGRSGEFEAEMAQRYGRLTLQPDGQVTAQPPGLVEESGLVRSRQLGAEPQAFPTSQQVASGAAGSAPVAVQAPKRRGVAYGSHIQARLVTNLDTRTIGNGPVEALLSIPFVNRGQVLLPTRTMAYGTATESGGRFTIRFSRLRLPDDTEVPIEGIALARDDGKPGLASSSKVGQEQKKPEGLASNIAKGTGNLLLDTVAGGLPQSVARNAGQTALNHQEAEPAASHSAYLLDAGVVFDIFVEKAF